MDFLSVFLLLLLLPHVPHDALGQEVVTAHEGAESVSLPFTVAQPLKNSPSVLWSRGSEEIHLRDGDEDDLRKQSSVFKNRTRMNPDAFQTRNLTLVLMNPTISDTGSYSCVVQEDGVEVGHITVALRVQRKEPPPSLPPVSVGAVVGVIAVFLVVTGVVLLLRCLILYLMCQQLRKEEQEDGQVIAYEGDDSVSLPFPIRRSLLSSKSSVEWRRWTETVHLREQQGDVLSGQSDEFKDRTEMKPDALETGNLTLTLKYPRFSDRGTYSCVVKVGSKEKKLISVKLRVYMKQVTVDDGAESVSLPFHLPMSLLSSKSSVEWRRWSNTVHLREQQGDVLRGQSDEFKGRTQMKPGALKNGNLTLTLKYPKFLDSGTYSCEVKEGSKEVKRISVELRVYRKQVTVYDGDDSVSLKIYISRSLLSSESSIEWKRGTETVHLRDQQGDVLSGQSEKFKGRTEMKQDALKTGDLTLTLKYPRVSDSDIYSCEVKKGSTEVRRISVELRVIMKQVTVDEGDDSVSLLFHIPMSLLSSESSESSVEWKRGSETVHLREQQGDVFRGQSDEFKDRTEMKPDALETGDLTLFLKDPRVSDSGTYSCVVKEGSTVVRLISVELRVNSKILLSFF